MLTCVVMSMTSFLQREYSETVGTRGTACLLSLINFVLKPNPLPRPWPTHRQTPRSWSGERGRPRRGSLADSVSPSREKTKSYTPSLLAPVPKSSNWLWTRSDLVCPVLLVLHVLAVTTLVGMYNYRAISRTLSLVCMSDSATSEKGHTANKIKLSVAEVSHIQMIHCI